MVSIKIMILVKHLIMTHTELIVLLTNLAFVIREQNHTCLNLTHMVQHIMAPPVEAE